MGAIQRLHYLLGIKSLFLAQTLINIVKSRVLFGKAYPGNFGMEHRILKPGMAGLSANVIKKAYVTGLQKGSLHTNIYIVSRLELLEELIETNHQLKIEVFPQNFEGFETKAPLI